MTWKLLVKVYKTKEVTISWDHKSFPVGYSFLMKVDKKIVNMQKEKSVTLKENVTVVITAEKEIMPEMDIELEP